MSAPTLVPLKEVATVDSGPAFKSALFGDEGEGVPLLRGENIEPGSLRWTRTKTWPRELLDGYEHLLIEEDDLILGMDRPVISTGLKLARARRSDLPALLVQRVARIRPTDIDARYLQHWLSAGQFTRHLQTSATGTQLPHVTLATIKNFQVPRFSAQTERRILDLLDDHLSRLDAAHAQAQLGLRRLDTLRVASMRRALAAERDWRVAPLADWLEHSIGGLWGSSPGSDEIDVCVVRVTEMKAWGRIDPATAATRSIGSRQLPGRKLVDGDLLLEKSGGGPKSPVGRVGLVESPHEPSICSNFMQLMRPDRSRVNPRFLHYALNAFHLSGGTAPLQTASTNIRNIKASEYLQIPIGAPDLDKQDALVEEIDGELEAADRLEAATLRASTRSGALRRSLLTAAFSGRLTSDGCDFEGLQEVAG